MDEDLKELIDQWKQKAENDLKTVRILLKEDDVPTDTVCFHCQQTVEKYLKLYLVSKGKLPEKNHNIRAIREECVKSNKNFASLKGIGYLSDYAVDLRYPDDFYLPDRKEAEEAYADALRVKEFVLSLLKDELLHE